MLSGASCLNKEFATWQVQVFSICRSSVALITDMRLLGTGLHAAPPSLHAAYMSCKLIEHSFGRATPCCKQNGFCCARPCFETMTSILLDAGAYLIYAAITACSHKDGAWFQAQELPNISFGVCLLVDDSNVYSVTLLPAPGVTSATSMCRLLAKP